MPAPAPPQPADPLARLRAADELGAEYLAAYAARFAARQAGRATGPTTGLPALDTALGGELHPRTATLVLGNTGVGKTAFVMQAALGTCAVPAPVLFVTTELDAGQLFERAIAAVTGMAVGALQQARVPTERVSELAAATSDALRGFVLADAIGEPAPPRDVGVWLAALAERGPFALCIIDSIHMWAARWAPPEATEYQAISLGMMQARALAVEHGAAVLATGEMNRDGLKNGGGLNTGAGSRRLEYASDVVCELRRAAGAKPDGRGAVPVTIAVHKNRFGMPREVEATFNGSLQRFGEA
ncbi:MAG TPA: DnaB-like helicase C-terminal domain-containing protein [Candidatus Dormibacteraeota bacterium]|nr:DnaB-like helicase C-terminal domain-containing protein [Candidatus Dormibacteraeota bacterium]